jgi:hypothetical protein
LPMNRFVRFMKNRNFKSRLTPEVYDFVYKLKGTIALYQYLYIRVHGTLLLVEF